MKVEELRTELKKRGISFTYHDRKAGLIAMLLTAIETATHDEDNADTDFLYPDTVQVVDSILPDDDSKGGFALAKPGEDQQFGYSLTPRTSDLVQRIKSLKPKEDLTPRTDPIIPEEEDGLKSFFFVYQWGPKDYIHDCYHKFYVEYGYRPNSSFYQAFTSLLSWHNETMNIWSHLIGFACAFAAAITFVYEQYVSPIPGTDGADAVVTVEGTDGRVERFLLGSFIFCASACLLLSTIYHWFQCLSPDFSSHLLRLDLTGIALLVGSSYFPAVYFGFYCHYNLRVVYLIVSVFVLALGLLAPWLTITVRGYPINTYIFVSLVLTGIVPCSHWMLITPEFYKKQLYTGFLWLFFWYGLGFTFYITAIPESFFPKRFWAVILTPSHTLWHVCVLCAVYVWFHHIWQYEALLSEHGCKPYKVSNYTG